MFKKFFLRCILIIKSVFSVIYINILILFSKAKNKKIFFFYYPRELATGIHTFYIEDLFKNFLLDSTVMFGHKTHHMKLDKNYIYIKESFLKFILGVDIFISTAVCDKFIKNSNDNIGVKCRPNFNYRSDTNKKFLSVNQIKKLIKKYKNDL